MIREVRDYYRLEEIWGDAPRLELELSGQELQEGDAA